MTATQVDLRDEIIELAPWHLEVQVTPGMSTAVSLEAAAAETSGSRGPVELHNPEQGFNDLLGTIYPDGLDGRSVLDCACNCGAYLFWAKEAGAGECLGFDVREHWIEQARFLRERRTVAPTDDMRFEVWDLHDLPDKGLQPFDITVFNGIFYHLPDPIAGLRIAADLTRELIIVNTMTYHGAPDGFFAVNEESQEQILSGVHGLSWRPTGPDVMETVLRWAGFEETWLIWWMRQFGGPESKAGRMQVIGSKRPYLLDPLWAWPEQGWNPIVEPDGDR